jgi:hypothetical protein
VAMLPLDCFSWATKRRSSERLPTTGQHPTAAMSFAIRPSLATLVATSLFPQPSFTLTDMRYGPAFTHVRCFLRAKAF